MVAAAGPVRLDGAFGVLIASPILIWNLKNDFISFTYQSGRVAPGLSSLRLDYFGYRDGRARSCTRIHVTWFLIAAAAFAVARGRSDRGPRRTFASFS